MIKEKAQVIMLPTEEVLKNGLQPISVCNKPINKSSLIFPTTGAYARRLVKQGNQAYHLYIVSNEEIKKGDWYLHNQKPNGLRVSNSKAIPMDAKKIIATTDTSLKIGNPRCEFDDDKVLPQPSREFIEKYCRVGGINEVMVEYIHTRPGDCGCNGMVHDGCHWADDIYNLKVNSHNEITIHPIKDSWNRKEVIELLNRYAVIFKPLKRTTEEIDKWIEENL